MAKIDTIVGKENKGAIVTIVERQTGFVLMKKLPEGKGAKGLANVVIDLLLPYKYVVHSMTSDNGTKFAEHKLITKKSVPPSFLPTFFILGKGVNEYTNKLIRQHVPKKQTFNNYNEQNIKDIQHKINRKPRKKLQFNNPKHLFYTNLDNIVTLGS